MPQDATTRTSQGNPAGDGRDPGGAGSGADHEGFVTRERAAEIVSARLSEEKAKLERQFESRLAEEIAKVKQQPAPPRTYTRAELEAAVEKGVTTREQANAVWDRQQREETERIAREAATREIQTSSRKDTLLSRIAKYTEFEPQLLVEGSDARSRIAREVQVQMSEFGLKGMEAEYAALRSIYGPEAALAVNTNERERSAHQDTLSTGGRGSSGAGAGSDEGPPADMPQHYREHYQKLLGPGKMYRDWKAVREEWKYHNPRVVRRGTARVRAEA